jgi:hypothetical protein
MFCLRRLVLFTLFISPMPHPDPFQGRMGSPVQFLARLLPLVPQLLILVILLSKHHLTKQLLAVAQVFVVAHLGLHTHVPWICFHTPLIVS